MTQKRVSIALTTYNGADFLPSQLQSYVSQSKMPDELVVCDDSSQDETLSILNRFKDHAPFPVTIYQNEHTLGVTRNFEQAISRCTGDIIFISDQDDHWLTDKIKTTFDVFQDNPSVHVVHSNMWICDEQLSPSNTTKLDTLHSIGLHEPAFMPGCGTAITKAWASFSIPVDSPHVGYDIWIGRLAREMHVSSLVKEPLMYYRRHRTNASNWTASETNVVKRLMTFTRDAFRFSPVKARWSANRDFFRNAVRRILERRELLTRLGLGDRIDPAVERLTAESQRLAKRIDAIEQRRANRLPQLWSSYLDKNPRTPKDILTLLKDSLRPSE